MIFAQFAVNFFVIVALSSSSWGNRAKFGCAVSAQKHEEHARIDVSKEEESFISEDGLDISRERKLSKKNAPMQPKPPTPIPPTSGPLDVFKKVRTAYTMPVFIDVSPNDVLPNIFTNTVINHIIVSQISILPPLFHSLIYFRFRRNPNKPTEL